MDDGTLMLAIHNYIWYNDSSHSGASRSQETHRGAWDGVFEPSGQPKALCAWNWNRQNNEMEVGKWQNR